MSMEPYLNREFGFIDDADRQYGSGSVPICARTSSDSPDPLLTLVIAYYMHQNWALREVQLVFNDVDHLFCSRFEI